MGTKRIGLDFERKDCLIFFLEVIENCKKAASKVVSWLPITTT